MDYESFTLTEMSAACGGVIEGIDLSKELTNAQFNEIHSALLDRTVIIFRDQKISSHQQVAFSRRFGEPQPAARCGPRDSGSSAEPRPRKARAQSSRRPREGRRPPGVLTK